LPEVRAIGAEIKQVAQTHIPTLVKYANGSPYLEKIATTYIALDATQPEPPGVQLVHHDPDAETRFIAACIYRWSGANWEAALARAQQLAAVERATVLADALGARAPFDAPLRELEHITLTFTAVMDQGAYYEFKRHRMMTQTTQALTPAAGYAVPLPFAQAGLTDTFTAAMETARQTYTILARDFPAQAAYVLTNAHNRRVLFTLNMRQTFHFCRLRGAPNAHFSIRRIAAQMLDILRDIYPALTSYLIADCPPPAQIEQDYFWRCT
jgi:thymidylate synthase ThyX